MSFLGEGKRIFVFTSKKCMKKARGEKNVRTFEREEHKKISTETERHI